MTKLTLTNHAQTNTTVLENEFIDKYMVNANGEYVKVYLLLLRHLNNPDNLPTISQIADMLDYTEKDVIRALNYWKRQGLLDYESRSDASAGAAQPPRQAVSDTAGVSSIQQFRSRKEFKELLFVAEQYLGKVLSPTEVEIITYLYETLQISADLIEYLIEYCVENNHRSIHYIKKVAISWHEQNITTVEQAKCNTLLYNKNCYSVLNAFGIRGRAPAASEVAFIRRWNDEYCFSQEIILEACARTMNALHKPDFNYTDSILKRWLEKGVHSKTDIAALDAAHQKESEKKNSRRPARKGQTASGTETKPGRFNNFEGRSYDMDDLERKLLQQ